MEQESIPAACRWFTQSIGGNSHGKSNDRLNEALPFQLPLELI